MQPRKVPAGRRPRRPAPSHGRTLRYRAPPPYVYPRRGAGAPADEDVAPRRWALPSEWHKATNMLLSCATGTKTRDCQADLWLGLIFLTGPTVRVGAVQLPNPAWGLACVRHSTIHGGSQDTAPEVAT
jgi:hypothetical protein